MKGFDTSDKAKYYPTQRSRKMQYSMCVEPFFLIVLPYPPLRFLDPNNKT
jgi:hypothetical protein